MLRLNVKTGPAWLDLGFGVRLFVAPITSAMIATAAKRLDLAELPGDADPEVRFIEFAKAIAQVAVIEWDGVGDTEGNPIEPTDDAVAALMDLHQLNLAFREQYVAKGFLLVTEKKGSAPLPNGTSEGAQTTAEPVSEPAPSALHS